MPTSHMYVPLSQQISHNLPAANLADFIAGSAVAFPWCVSQHWALITCNAGKANGMLGQVVIMCQSFADDAVC